MWVNLSVIWQTVTAILYTARYVATASLSYDVRTTDTCDPVVDILYILDGSLSVRKQDFEEQKGFILTIARSHSGPAEAVRFGFVVCNDKYTTHTAFHESNEDIAAAVKSLKQYPESNFTHRSTCLQGMNRVLTTAGRTNVDKIAVLLAGGGKWNDKDTVKQAAIAKVKGISLITVAIGITDFECLNSLQALASGEDTFFVLAGYSDLQRLASKFSKGSCRPISVDNSRTKTNREATTRSELSTKQVKCFEINSTTYRKFIPGFGWIRIECENETKLGKQTCSCQT